ncbi:MAG: hypothetical protein IKL00_02480 [Oscillospiraceae bacterium]|nr:hypothetical protein [Oscillospiraceae bacterium]
MKGKACIYCGTTEHLSASDIIPDALTNAKIINPNVCQDAHNSKFSDMFESKVIQELALITNFLDVKSSKGKNYARYQMTFKVGEDEYSTCVSSETELFQKINTSLDGKTKIGPIEQIKRIKGASDDTINQVDLNNIMIEWKTIIKLQVFFSNEMYRLIAKIAYEWYCLFNSVQGNLEEFNDIIRFITTGDGVNPVQFVGNGELYKVLEDIGNYGSHTLIAYLGNDNSVNVIVSLFGIAIYNVKLLSNTIEECSNNCIYQELSLDSKRKSFCFKTIEDLRKNIGESFHKASPIDTIRGFNIMYLDDTAMTIKFMYSECYKSMQNNLMCVLEPTQETVELLKLQTSKIFQESALTVRNLKRFVKEHKKYWNDVFRLNPNTGDKKTMFLYYLIFIIGTNDIQNLSELNSHLKNNFGNSEIKISDELTNEFIKIIMGTNNYQEIIRKGAALVESWSFE